MAAAKDAGWLSDVQVQAVDRHKIDRAKQAIMKETKKRDSENLKDVVGFLFDGRKDDTKVMERGEDGKLHRKEIKEEHYSLCSEPGGEYLTHMTVDHKTRKKGETAAQQLANSIFEWLEENGVSQNIVAIGGDSTNVNTGWKGGAIQFIEKSLKRKVIWLICALHTNELPLRHLMINIDGKTLSDNKFAGPIGKLVPNATNLKPKTILLPIDTTINLIQLDEEIVNDLSDDQKYLYQITQGIKSGIFPDFLRERQIGPHSNARWLNLASRLCRIWCSEHGLEGAEHNNLKMLVQFIVGVYVPMWFEIKVKKSWLEGPRHVLKQLFLVRDLDEDIQKHVIPYMKSSAWNAHSEHILQTMLAGEGIEEQDFAIQQILRIKGESELGDLSVRIRGVLKIN